MPNPILPLSIGFRSQRGSRERVDPLGGEKPGQLGSFLLGKKFLSGKTRGTFEWRKGRHRPDALQVRLAIWCTRLRPRVSRGGWSLTRDN